MSASSSVSITGTRLSALEYSPSCLNATLRLASAPSFEQTQTMAFLNDNYLKLKAGYLFPEIGRRVKAFADSNPDAAQRIIRCGIGDVTEPIPPAAVKAMHMALHEMATRKGFHGYGPEQGYEWLR